MDHRPLLAFFLLLFLSACGSRGVPSIVGEGAEAVRLLLARSAGEPSPHDLLGLCSDHLPYQAALAPDGCLPLLGDLSLGVRPVLGGLLEARALLRVRATGERWLLTYRLYPARGAGDFAATVLAPGEAGELPSGPLYLGSLPKGRLSWGAPLLLAPCPAPAPEGCGRAFQPLRARPPRGAVADLNAPFPALRPFGGYSLGPFAALRLVPRGRGVEVRLSDGRVFYTEGPGRPLLLNGKRVGLFPGAFRAGLLRVEGGEAGTVPLALVGGRLEAFPVRGEALALLAEGEAVLFPGRYRALVGSRLDRAVGEGAVVEGAYVGFRPPEGLAVEHRPLRPPLPRLEPYAPTVLVEARRLP